MTGSTVHASLSKRPYHTIVCGHPNEALERVLGIQGYWPKSYRERDIFVNIERDTGYLDLF